MHIDKGTLEDLEILGNKTENTLFSRFNKTVTKEGEYRLKKHFINPCQTIDEIYNIQNILKFLVNDLINWKLPDVCREINLIEKYVDNNYLPVYFKRKSLVMIESYFYKNNYPDIHEMFKIGVVKTIILIQEIYKLYNKHSKEKLPDLLKQIISTIGSVFEEEYFKEIFEIEIIGIDIAKIYHFDKIIREFILRDVKKLLEMIYELDFFMAMAKATKEFNLKFPEFIENEKAFVEFKGLSHPLIKNPQKNDVLFYDNTLMFVTGPNMAGKTTFLKSSIVAVYLAHLGMGVAAENMSLTLFDRIYSSINNSDNISSGYSYYYSEIDRIKKLASYLQAGEKLFVVINEMFRGTNISDAIIASEVTCRSFAEWDNSIFIISSHLQELGYKLREKNGICFYYFEAKLENNELSFDYLIKEGISEQKLGLFIFEREKILSLLKKVSV